SPWAMAPSPVDVPTTDVPSWTATEIDGVAVSNASRSTVPSVVVPRGGTTSTSGEQGAAQRDPEPSPTARPDRHHAHVLGLDPALGAERLIRIGRPGLDGDREPTVRELLGHPRPPFDDRDRVLGGRVEVDVVDLGGIPEPVRVDVHERR